MPTEIQDQFHAQLSIAALNQNDQARDDLVAAILKLAPTSPLYANPAIKAEIGVMGATWKAYKDAGKTSAQSAKQHKTDVAAKASVRNANNKSIQPLRTLAESNAASLDDLESLALKAYEGRPPAPSMAGPVLDVVLGRKNSGRATVKAHEMGATRHRYMAESSGDPIGTWSVLVGAGKARKLVGKPGDKVWVRFAVQYRGQQGEWSTPVLVVLPRRARAHREGLAAVSYRGRRGAIRMENRQDANA
jgi:hypothetical protein